MCKFPSFRRRESWEFFFFHRDYTIVKSTFFSGIFLIPKEKKAFFPQSLQEKKFSKNFFFPSYALYKGNQKKKFFYFFFFSKKRKECGWGVQSKYIHYYTQYP